MPPILGRPSFRPRPKADPAKPPAPHKGKDLLRRQAMLHAASELIPYLPTDEGQATHAVISGYDLMSLVSVTLNHYGQKCPFLRLVTLSFNRANVSDIEDLLAGKVEAVTLLASTFYRAHNRDEFAETLRIAAKYPAWNVACCNNHAKVVTMQLADGQRLVIEGSANLRANGGNWEQIAVIRDAALHDWHAAWIDELTVKHATRAEEEGGQDAGKRSPESRSRR